MANSPDGGLSLIVAGTDVPIVVGQTRIVFNVQPLKVRHLGQFRRELTNALLEYQSASGKSLAATLGSLANDDKAQADAAQAAILESLPLMIPLLIEHALPLVESCVKGTVVDADGKPVAGATAPVLSDLPHWHLAPLATAWIAESFGSEERVRPWVTAAEQAILSLSGRKVNLWSALSGAFSPPGTDTPIASITGSDSSTLSSPTPSVSSDGS